MEFLKGILTNKNFYTTIAIIVVGIIGYKLLKKFYDNYYQKHSKEISKKKQTYIKLIKNVSKYVFGGLLIIIVLQVNGINVAGFVAGLGVVSVIAGLALQDALKDIIQGFNLIIDDYFSVGDVVVIDGIEGKILEIGLKTTKMKNILTGGTYIVANRNISSANLRANLTFIDIPLPYEEKLSDMEKIIELIINDAKKVKNVKNVEYKGISEFQDSAITYKLLIECKPEDQFQAKRDINCIIKRILDENNISIPYQQIDIKVK